MPPRMPLPKMSTITDRGRRGEVVGGSGKVAHLDHTGDGVHDLSLDGEVNVREPIYEQDRCTESGPFVPMQQPSRKTTSRLY